MSAKEDFAKAASLQAYNYDRIHLLKEHMGRHGEFFAAGKEQFKDLELARERASHARSKAIENLDKYLLEFESNATRNGCKIVWAPEKQDALDEVESILRRHKINSIVKSKSSVCEEVGLYDYLTKKGYNIAETDVADVVLRKTNEPSSHVILPAIHKNKAEIQNALEMQAAPFGEEISREATVNHITEPARQKYFSAQAGITGCNFLIADGGSIALTENEGNIVFSSGLPPVHIVIAGIDKVIPSLSDLDNFWPLLATYATGQKITSYNSIIRGPRMGKETDGPTDVYIVLVDNGRTDVLAQKEQRPALTCIKCGACANVCPVYKTIGGQAYGITNPGPVGAIIEPLRKKMDDYIHLSEASTLCGKCTTVCPVKIDLHTLLVENRRDAVEKGGGGMLDNYLWKLEKKGMLSRKWMNRGDTFKSLIIKSSYKKNWGDKRDFPAMAKQSFNQLWREKNNEK